MADRNRRINLFRGEGKVVATYREDESNTRKVVR